MARLAAQQVQRRVDERGTVHQTAGYLRDFLQFFCANWRVKV